MQKGFVSSETFKNMKTELRKILTENIFLKFNIVKIGIWPGLAHLAEVTNKQQITQCFYGVACREYYLFSTDKQLFIRKKTIPFITKLI